MIKALILTSLLCAPVAFAQQPKDELESPIVNTPSDLKREPSFILKVDKDGSMATLQTDKKDLTKEEVAQLAATGKFVSVPKGNIKTQDELETSRGTPAWIFCGVGFGYTGIYPGFWNGYFNSWYAPVSYYPYYGASYYWGWRGGWGFGRGWGRRW